MRGRVYSRKSLDVDVSMLATRNRTETNCRRCGSNNHFIKKEKAHSGIRSRRKYIEPRSEQEVSAMDISKRTRNCVLSISETTELNATTDADLIVATPISYALARRE